MRTVDMTSQPSERLCNKSPADYAAVQVRMAFASRRKMISNTLSIGLESAQIGAALSAAGLSPNARAQDLTLEQFVALARCIAEARLVQGDVQNN